MGITHTFASIPVEIRDFSVRFTARMVEAELNVDSLIVPGRAIVLSDGGLIRWLGMLELLLQREIVITTTPVNVLHGRLRNQGLDSAAIDALLHWCLHQGILSTDLLPLDRHQ
jgi:hypothetical protein